ncbi:MAG TPA: PrsW family glutamic-type intramembrane protease [Bacteroidales bacterium]|nr:PrsW family glutamic-type intramembrane protease [Bacteroidales bacterium]
MKFLTNKGFLGIVLLVIIGAVCTWALDGKILSLTGGWQILFSLGVTLLPGLLWLWFFYMQDKYEKEPKQILLGVFVLGGLAAYTLSKPLIELISPDVSVFEQSLLNEFLIAFLITGMIQMLVVFITVRYSIYFSDEFNEPADGVIYSIAAGLGFAAVYNITYLNSLESMNMGVVITRIINFYLVMAIFSGIMGYFIGFAKFSNRSNMGRDLFMCIGLLLAVLLHALYYTVLSKVQGMAFDIWKELIISAGVVVFIYIIMYFLLHRSVEASPFKNIENKPE